MKHLFSHSIAGMISTADKNLWVIIWTSNDVCIVFEAKLNYVISKWHMLTAAICFLLQYVDNNRYGTLYTCRPSLKADWHGIICLPYAYTFSRSIGLTGNDERQRSTMTTLNEIIFRVTDRLCGKLLVTGEFPSQSPGPSLTTAI